MRIYKQYVLNMDSRFLVFNRDGEKELDISKLLPFVKEACLENDTSEGCYIVPAGTRMEAYVSDKVYRRRNDLVRPIIYKIDGCDYLYTSFSNYLPKYVSAGLYCLGKDCYGYKAESEIVELVLLSSGTVLRVVEYTNKDKIWLSSTVYNVKDVCYEVVSSSNEPRSTLVYFSNNNEPFINSIEYFPIPCGIVGEIVTAESEEAKKEIDYELDPNKKYYGSDAIDMIILFMQNSDLSKHIVRDDSGLLCVDLGSVDMWPDLNKSGWIMELNARIPIASSISVGSKFIKGKPHLCVVVHQNFK